MLGKLIKYEWKAVARIFFPSYIGLVIITCLGKILLSTKLYDVLPDGFQVLTTLLYVLSILIIFIGTIIYLIIRFYKNFYTDEGYLMHTLPVTTNQKIISKSIVSFVFNIISFMLCFFSIFILAITKEAYEAIPDAFVETKEYFSNEMGMNFEAFVIITIILLLISLISQIFMCYASISIGQLFHGHKVIGSIAGYIVLTTVSQVISALSLLFIRIDNLTEASMGSLIWRTYIITTIFSIVISAGYYFITYYMMQKKLNLD